jgi:RES domain-containing protein
MLEDPGLPALWLTRKNQTANIDKGAANNGWDAIPEGLVSRSAGSAWLRAGQTTLLTVPSVIIYEEDNVLINPTHPDAGRISASKVRRFVYDHRD